MGSNIAYQKPNKEFEFLSYHKNSSLKILGCIIDDKLKDDTSVVEFFNNKKNFNTEIVTFKSMDSLLNVCSEEYVYIYKAGAWLVRTPFSDRFINLKFALKIDDLVQDLFNTIKKEENKQTVKKLEAIHMKKIDISYDLLNISSNRKEKEFVVQVLISEDFLETVEIFGNMKKVMLFKDNLEESLSNQKTAKRLKI